MLYFELLDAFDPLEGFVSPDIPPRQVVGVGLAVFPFHAAKNLPLLFYLVDVVRVLHQILVFLVSLPQNVHSLLGQNEDVLDDRIRILVAELENGKSLAEAFVF